MSVSRLLKLGFYGLVFAGLIFRTGWILLRGRAIKILGPRP
ncbi:MAG TPA: hypothetical protein PLI51_10355 [bacterium]|nr:hypothetical protein [bacterium]HPQ67116.1 hypothetical protein [bacterium]